MKLLQVFRSQYVDIRNMKQAGYFKCKYIYFFITKHFKIYDPCPLSRQSCAWITKRKERNKSKRCSTSLSFFRLRDFSFRWNPRKLFVNVTKIFINWQIISDRLIHWLINLQNGLFRKKFRCITLEYKIHMECLQRLFLGQSYRRCLHVILSFTFTRY